MPELVLLDLPLVMGRAVYAQVLEDDETDRELRAEITALRERAEAFWSRHLERCFPFAETGPRVVSLVRRPFGGLLRLLNARGKDVSPDPIDAATEQLIQTEWMQMLSVGIERVVAGILLPEHRTAAIEREESRRDRDAFPPRPDRPESIGLALPSRPRATTSPTCKVLSPSCGSSTTCCTAPITFRGSLLKGLM